MMHFLKKLFVAVFVIQLIILSSTVSIGGNIHAEERNQWRSMIIIDKTGQEYNVNLSDQIKITFANSNMILANELTNISIQLDDISEWKMSEKYFDDDILSGINDPVLNTAISIFSFDNHIKISSDALSGSLLIVDIQGRIVREYAVSGKVDIDLADLSKGIYLVCFANKSMKITIR